MGHKIELAAIDAFTGGALTRLLSQYEAKYSRRRDKEPEESQLRKIALAQLKRERKAEKKGKQ